MLQEKIKKLEKKQSGGDSMSKIISGLVGQQCNILVDNIFEVTGMMMSSNNTLDCTILEVDDEWILINFINKKTLITKVIRIDSIKNIELKNTTT